MGVRLDGEDSTPIRYSVLPINVDDDWFMGVDLFLLEVLVGHDYHFVTRVDQVRGRSVDLDLP